jgi:hypothetical protein
MSQMAARSDHTIEPELYVSLGLELGIARNNKDLLTLTRLGDLMFTSAKWPPYDVLNSNQLRLMSPELLGHPDIADSVTSIIRLMHWMPESSTFLYPRSVRLKPDQYLAIRLLLVTEFAAVDGPYVTMSKPNFERLDSILGLRGQLTRSEDDLWSSLRETNLRARVAEEFVADYERSRLDAAGRHDLSEFVNRISERDVDAGFDIRSFNTDGTMRYIEVKSSTNSHVQFFWTSAERSFALEHRDSYWIYFVPRAHELPSPEHEVIEIQDPVAHEGETLHLEPSTYKVRLTRNQA